GADFLQCGCDRRWLTVPGRVPLIGCFRDKPHHPRSHAGQEQWRTGRTWTARDQLTIRRAEIPPMEIDTTLAEQWPNDGDCLLEPPRTVIERCAECFEFRLVPAGAKPENQ